MSSFEEEVRKMTVNVVCHEAKCRDLDSALDMIAAGLAKLAKRFDPTTVLVYGLEVYAATSNHAAVVLNGKVTLITREFLDEKTIAVEVAVVSEPSPAIKLALRSGMGLRLVG